VTYRSYFCKIARCEHLLFVRSKRRASVLVAIASVAIPAALIFLSTAEAEREVRAYGGPICNLPFLADFHLGLIYLRRAVGSCFIVEAIACRRPSPARPRRRLLELAALLLPLIIVGVTLPVCC
jgi:hypothetical protein